MTTTATLSEFAALRGVKPSYVTKLKQHGRLVLTDDGRVEVEASIQRIEDTKDPNRDDVRARHAAARGPKGGAESTAMDGGSAEREAVSERGLLHGTNAGAVFPPPAVPESPAPIHAAPESPRAADAISASFQKSRALGEHFAAKTRALEFLKEIGEVVELSMIRDEVENILAVTRSAFDNLPGQLAPQLVTMTDETQIDKLLQDNIEAILAELSQRMRTTTTTHESKS